jgi:hypothetical protein
MKLDEARDVLYMGTAFISTDMIRHYLAFELSTSLATVIAAAISGFFVLLARQIEARFNSYWRARACDLERELARLRAELEDLNPYGQDPFS